MKRSTLLLATAFITMAALSGCTQQGEQPPAREEIGYVPPAVERYENHIEIEGQWGASAATGPNGQYGIGDPFVMRWNGKYYLYPSTSDPCDGIKVFESDDLVHWKDMGYAVAQSEPTVHGAYAPEVVYYKGYFYLCQSRAGKGHYVYRSESPTEGFKLISTTEGMNEGALDYGNLGMGIDGSFYVSDDGRLYLLHTSTPAGLQFNEITDITDIRTETIGRAGSLGTANLRHWIEGPGIFRRGDFSYLTYTGNHVISRGYRVAYSYAENLNSLTSFIQPTDNVTLMDTDAAHYGIGHSSNVNGPDLDSIYTAYHNLVGGGPARRFNLDRYFASGSVLTANGVTHRPVAIPSRATAEGYAEALKEVNGRYVLGETEGYFTAEFNFTPSEAQKLFFGNDYQITVEGGKITLEHMNKQLGEAQAELPAGRLVTVRVENGDGVGHLYVNGMRVVSWAAESAAGALGYATAEGVGYTAFTNDVFGTSDFEALKNFPTKFPATSYLKGEMRGYSIAKAERVKGGIRVGETERTVRLGDANAVVLSAGDWVKYAVDIGAKATYSLMAEVSPKSAGAQMRFTLGEKELTAKLPQMSAEGETVRVYLGDIEGETGITTFKAEVLSGEAEIVLFEAYEKDTGNVSLESFENPHGSVTLSDGTLTLTSPVAGGDAVAIWKSTATTDFEAEITFSGAAGIGTDFGIMLRASHYSYYPDQPAQSWRGYYLRLGDSLITLSRYDYGDCGALSAERLDGVDLTGGGTHTLKIRAENNVLTVILDDTVTLRASDECAFFGGSLGVYCRMGTINIHTLAFQTT